MPENKINSLSSLHFKNIDGKKIYLDIIKYDSKSSFEFIITPVKKSWKSQILNIIFFIFCLSLFFYVYNYFIKLFFFIWIYYYLKLLNIFGVKNESILMVAPLGFQLTTNYNFGYSSSQFIPWSFIKDIIINEAFLFQHVIYYLAIMTHEKSDNQLIPLFKNTRPQLAALEVIYQNIQKTIINYPL